MPPQEGEKVLIPKELETKIDNLSKIGDHLIELRSNKETLEEEIRKVEREAIELIIAL